MTGHASNSLNLKGALGHAAMGIAIIPCRPDKAPYVKNWPTAGATDNPTIRDWWLRHPDAIPGIPCGANGLLVVDCDRKNGVDGVAEWEGQCARNGVDLDGCFIVETPSGGRHYYFRQPPGPLLGNTVGKIAAGIDTRGDGGQVIAPGAMLPDGRSYRALAGALTTTPLIPEELRIYLAGLERPQLASALTNDQITSPIQPATEHEHAYALKALADKAAELASMQARSGRNNALNSIAYRMGRMIGAGWIEQVTVEQALVEASRRNGYEAKDGSEAVRKTLQSGLRRGIENPHPPLEEAPILEGVLEFSRQVQSHFNNRSKAHGLNPVSLPTHSLPVDHALIMHRVADVEAQPVHWLWHPRIALGKVTLISGDPGLGKSQLTAFLAAKISTGGLWPNNDGQSPSGSVLMLSCEDDVADTIRPRLEAIGADLERVHVIEAVRIGEGRSRGFSITADLVHLEAALKRIPDARLVTVDPITAYLGGTDTHRTSDVRAALGPLQTLAAHYGVAVVAVSHLNKAGGGGKSVNAVTGSGAFVAAARASFLVIKDEADENRRLLIESKNNLGRAPGLSYKINQRTLTSGIVAPFVEFEPGTVSTTADEALGAAILSGKGGAIREAKEFLRTELALGDVAANAIMNRASDAGIAQRTLRRAADNVGVEKAKEGFDGGWIWRLSAPSKMAMKSEDGQGKNMDTLGELWPPSTKANGT